MDRINDNRSGTAGARGRRRRSLGFVVVISALVLGLIGEAAGLIKQNTFSTGSFVAEIADLDVTASPIQVKKRGQIKDVDVSVRVDHQFVGDIGLTLVSPAGTTVNLSTFNGGGGADYGSGEKSCGGAPTRFDDEAGRSVLAAEPPYVGALAPEQPLAALDGGNSRGRWTLLVIDGGVQDAGELYCWSLEVKRKVKPRRKQGK